MIEHVFQAMNTEWCLIVTDLAAAREAERRVHDLEARLSRFRPDSALSRLNRERCVRDADLALVIRAAMRFRGLTAGAFDPTIGAAVIALGYDRSFERLGPRVESASYTGERPLLHVDGDRVELEGEGLVDLGGIAKGFTVDAVAAGLTTPFLVDGGGDIRVGGADWPIGLADDRAVRLSDAAIATSSARVRRWTTASGDTAHHIVNPATGRPADRVAEAVVIAPDATTADVLATALVADPTAALSALAALGAQAMVLSETWWMTPGMRATLLREHRMEVP